MSTKSYEFPGLGNVEKQHFSRSSYGGGGGGKDSEPTTLKKPTIRIKDFIKVSFKWFEWKELNGIN